MPYKSSEGRSGGKLVKSNLSINIGGYLLKSVANQEYFYGPDTETTLVVSPGIKNIVIAGVAPGGNAPGISGTSPGPAGGGGAGNVTGFTIAAAPLWDQTIYIKVPAASSPTGNGSPIYVKTGSHSGTSLWEAGAGGPGTSAGVMIAGSGNSGGAGGSGSGNGGTSVTGAGAGGGAGGAHLGPNNGRGGAGGSASVPSYLQPLNAGPATPWTMSGSPGGNPGPTQSQPGTPAPYGGGQGGRAGNPWPNYNGGGGGGGGGVVLYYNGQYQNYGGGGGGMGSPHGSGTHSAPPTINGQGTGGFIIVQLVKHT